MSNDWDVVGRPKRTDLKFNLPRGTRVRVLSTEEGCIEGLVAQNPTAAGTPTFLELIQAVKVIGIPPRERLHWMGFLRLQSSNVYSYQIIENSKPQQQLAPKFRTEKIHHTIVIETEGRLGRFIDEIQKDDVISEIGLNFYGVFVGRDGKVSWIALFLKSTLVCIDALELPTSMKNYWNCLEQAIFGNERIKKVMYNARPIADYLWNRESVRMRNVDDLQVSEFILQFLGQHLTNMDNELVRYSSLNTMVERFIPGNVTPEEVLLLQEFENTDFSANSPLMERPISDKKMCKCVAVEMKVLLPLSKILQDIYMDRKKLCIRAQVMELVDGKSDKMESQNKCHLKIPHSVFQRAITHNGVPA